MSYKNIVFCLSLTVLNFSPNTILAEDNRSKFDSCTKMLSHSVQSLTDLLSSIYTLRHLDLNDLPAFLHATNNVAWEVVAPLLVAHYTAQKCGLDICHPTNSNTYDIAVSSSAAAMSAIVAYLLGSLPKEYINVLIEKATSVKK